jgi:serine/threonine-protein kinase
MAGNIVHDNIISIYDFGEEQGRPFIVMEFLRGESLRDAIKYVRTGDLKNKLTIALQVARALGYIHSKKIIHRDVKPENIHIDAAGKVKLMDFGIAKSEGLSLTRAGFTLGTPYYMAPEQVLGQQVTNLVDIYAFGVLLFELLAGVKPITGETVERIFNHILYEPLNLEPLKLVGAPQAVYDLITRCTTKAPVQRIQSFQAVCGELEQILETPQAPATAAVPVQSGAAAAPAKKKVAPPRTRPGVDIPNLLEKLPASLSTPIALAIISAVSVVLVLTLLYVLLSALRIV